MLIYTPRPLGHTYNGRGPHEARTFLLALLWKRSSPPTSIAKALTPARRVAGATTMAVSEGWLTGRMGRRPSVTFAYPSLQETNHDIVI